MVEAVQRTGVPFSTFDILEDEAVRQDLKLFSEWPTYPQLYAGGELLGGCDIVLAMEGDGSLKATLETALAGGKELAPRILETALAGAGVAAS